MAQTISDFKSGFNGGTRANRFSVNFTWPTGLGTDFPDLTFHVVTAKLPEGELGSISIPYRGRVAHFAGDRDYKPWTVTILDDTGTNESWSLFHKWSNALSSHKKNTATDQTYAVGDYLQPIKFTQLTEPTSASTTATGHSSLREINLQNAWPSEVGQIGLDMGEGGSLVSYTVTFTYDYYTILKAQIDIE